MSISVWAAGIKEKKKRERELTYSLCVTLGYFYEGLISKGVGSVLGKPQAIRCLGARNGGRSYTCSTERGTGEVTPKP